MAVSQDSSVHSDLQEDVSSQKSAASVRVCVYVGVCV